MLIAICDTGPLLAYFNGNNRYRAWAVALMKQVRPPMLVSEPVLFEVLYYLREDGVAVDPLFQMLERGADSTGIRYVGALATDPNSAAAIWPNGLGRRIQRRPERVAREIPGSGNGSQGFQCVSTERPPSD
jgi:hypothetical protein